MTDIEDDLRAFYTQEEDDPDAEQRITSALHSHAHRDQLPRGWRAHITLAPLAVAVIIALLAVGIVAIRHTSVTPQHSSTDVPAPSTVVTSFAGGITISHPAAWRYVARDPLYRGSGIGYFTTEPTRAQCHSTSDGYTCKSPVVHLDPQGIYVEVDGSSGVGGLPTSSPTSTVAGYPGQITDNTKVAGHCPTGSTETIDAVLQPLAADYGITVCLNEPTAQQRTEATAMINSFHLPGATPCPRSCPTHPATTTIHLTVGTHSYVLPIGGYRNITVPVGTPLPITVTINNSARAPITNAYLSVDSGHHITLRANTPPSGNVVILAQHAGPITNEQSLSATWTPTTLFGTNKCYLSLDYSIGGGSLGLTIATLTITD
jgi:hypothetical protein